MKRIAIILATVAVPGCFAPTDAETPLPGPRAEGAVVALENTDRLAVTSRLIEVDAAGCGPWLTESARLERWLAEKVTLEASGGTFALEWPSAGKRWAGRVVESNPAGGFVAELDGIYPDRSVRLELVHSSVAGGQRVEFRMGPFGQEMADEVYASGFRVGLGNALATLELAVRGESTTPPCPAPIERKFHSLESPREGLEAEMKMKNQPVKKP